MFLSTVYRIGEGLRKCPFGHFLYRTSQALCASSPGRGAKSTASFFEKLHRDDAMGLPSGVTERAHPANHFQSA